MVAETSCEVVPRRLLPLLQVIDDALSLSGCPCMSEEFVDLLSGDVDMLAAMQWLAFQIIGKHEHQLTARLNAEMGGDEMDMQHRVNELVNAVTPMTRSILLEWLASAWTFEEVLESKSAWTAFEVLKELEGHGVVRWMDGVPHLAVRK